MHTIESIYLVNKMSEVLFKPIILQTNRPFVDSNSAYKVRYKIQLGTYDSVEDKMQGKRSINNQIEKELS